MCMFVKLQCLKISFTVSVLNTLDEEYQLSNKDTLRCERCAEEFPELHPWQGSKRVKSKQQHTLQSRFSETEWDPSDQEEKVRSTFLMDSGGVYVVTMLNRG